MRVFLLPRVSLASRSKINIFYWMFWAVYQKLIADQELKKIDMHNRK